MNSIFELIGWLALIIPLGYASIYVFFCTVPTFGEALFTGTIYHRIAGFAMWGVLIFLWYKWLMAGVN